MEQPKVHIDASIILLCGILLGSSADAEAAVNSNVNTAAKGAGNYSTESKTESKAEKAKVQLDKALKNRNNDTPVDYSDKSMVSSEEMYHELGLDANSNNTNYVRGQGLAPWQKVGSPYKVNGIWYIPAYEPDYDETGIASIYGKNFQGKPTANGEIFDMKDVSVAHPTLPMPCVVEITNLENGRSILARVNDRGPFKDDQLIGVSTKAAELLGFKDKGSAKVRVKYVGIAPKISTKAQNFNAKPYLNLANDYYNKNQYNIANDNSKNNKLINSSTHYNSSSVSHKTIEAKPNLPQKSASTNNSVNNKKYGKYVQIASFANKESAINFAQKHNNLGEVNLMKTKNGDDYIYRVVIGPFVNDWQAKAKKDEINNSGIAGAQILAYMSRE